MRHAVLFRIDRMLLMEDLLLSMMMGSQVLLVEALSVSATVLDILNMGNKNAFFWMAFLMSGFPIVDIRIVPWSVGRHAFGPPQRTARALAGRWG
jgi:hypothetical protein